MENKEIKIGSRVIIRSNKYHGHLNYNIGIVDDCYGVDTIKVSLAGFYNPNAIKRHYYFNPSDLEVIDEEKLEIDSLSIKDVIFNDPATIILWKDGTKTVVKCTENDNYDPEKGMAMAICKKVLGNKGNYYNTFSKWLPEETEDNSSFKREVDKVVDAFNKLAEKYVFKASSEPKLITYREYIEKKYPENCSSVTYGGIFACPGSYVKTGPRSIDFNCYLKSNNNNCTKCFDQFIPLGSIDLRTGKPIYEEENK